MILFDTIRIQLQSMNRLAGAIIQGKYIVISDCLCGERYTQSGLNDRESLGRPT